VNEKDDEKVLVAVKTPIMPTATTALVPRELTIGEALEKIRKAPPVDPNAKRVRQQLDREMSGIYDVLAVTPDGITKVKPELPIKEIAVPREIRTSGGIETIPTAALEVQAYAPVGGPEQC
jgi:hypothetical protein